MGTTPAGGGRARAQSRQSSGSPAPGHANAPGRVQQLSGGGPASDAADNALANLSDKAATEPELLINEEVPVTLTVVDRLLMRCALALMIAGGLLLIGSFVPVSPDFGRDQPALANAASTVKPGFGVKAPLAGLLDRAGPADKPYLSGFVLRVRWADIEPQPGRVDLSRIRAGLRFAAKHGKRVVLRVTAGVDAPAWAQRLGGAPLPFFDHSQGRWLTLGRFWRPDYRREWGRLQAQLATAFDADPTLAQVNVCGTGEISCEVMLIFGADAHGRNGRTLIAAGYTPPLGRQH